MAAAVLITPYDSVIELARRRFPWSPVRLLLRHHFDSVGFALEDLAVVSSIQKSIGCGANEVFTFGQFEGCIVHFHRALNDALKT